MHNINDLVKKKTDSDAKIKDLKIKYFTKSDYNKFTNDILDAEKKNKKNTYFVNKSDISGFIKDSDLNKKIETLSTQAA